MQPNNALIILHSVLPSVAICAGIMTVGMRPSENELSKRHKILETLQITAMHDQVARTEDL